MKSVFKLFGFTNISAKAKATYIQTVHRESNSMFTLRTTKIKEKIRFRSNINEPLTYFLRCYFCSFCLCELILRSKWETHL